MQHRDASQKIVRRYLQSLEQALRSLPAERRAEVLAEVRDHIAEARRGLASGDTAGLRDVLARIGSPSAIAREAGVDVSGPPAWQDALVPWLLLVGGFLLGIGWLVGLVWLWSSPSWSLRDKILGTAVWPGGLLSVVAAGGLAVSAQAGVAAAGTPSGSPAGLWGIVLVVVLVVSPIVVAVHLERTRRRVRSVSYAA